MLCGCRRLALLVALPTLLECTHALEVGFSFRSRSPLVPIQDFGSVGGQINVTIDIAPAACSDGGSSGDSLDPLDNATSCWEALDLIYLAVFSRHQWENITYGINGAVLGANTCAQAATGWSSLSFATWQDAAGGERLLGRWDTCLRAGLTRLE